MKKILSLLCLALLGVGTSVNAGNPQAIDLSAVVISGPQGGPQQGSGGMPSCDYCFTATITDDILNVWNESDEIVNVVVTDLTTFDVIISTQMADELEEQLPAGLYQLEIIPTTYAPMEGFFEVEE